MQGAVDFGQQDAGCLSCGDIGTDASWRQVVPQNRLQKKATSRWTIGSTMFHDKLPNAQLSCLTIVHRYFRCVQRKIRLLTPGAMADFIVPESPSLGNMFLENNISKQSQHFTRFQWFKDGFRSERFSSQIRNLLELKYLTL